MGVVENLEKSGRNRELVTNLEDQETGFVGSLKKKKQEQNGLVIYIRNNFLRK